MQISFDDHVITDPTVGRSKIRIPDLKIDFKGVWKFIKNWLAKFVMEEVLAAIITWLWPQYCQISKLAREKGDEALDWLDAEVKKLIDKHSGQTVPPCGN